MDAALKDTAAVINEARSAAANVIAPPPRTPAEAISDAVRAYEITSEGLIISAFVGALFGAGSSLLESKPDYHHRSSRGLRRTLGWAFLEAPSKSVGTTKTLISRGLKHTI